MATSELPKKQSSSAFECPVRALSGVRREVVSCYYITDFHTDWYFQTVFFNFIIIIFCLLFFIFTC